jgi:hypothetical protein
VAAGGTTVRTVGAMRRLGGTHLDRQRTLLPADYAVDRHRFGRDPQLAFHVPPDGDHRSMEIARIQHQLVLGWRRHPDAPSGAALARRFGFSKQTLSRVALGERWSGETVMAALLYGQRGRRKPRERHVSS